MKTECLKELLPPIYGYFDPPWTPAFLRRNEVMVRTGSGGSKAARSALPGPEAGLRAGLAAGFYLWVRVTDRMVLTGMLRGIAASTEKSA